MTDTAPKIAFLARGGSLYVGVESGDLDTPGLRYPALVQMVSLPAPGALAGQMGINTITVPVALPLPWLPAQPGETLIPVGADDATYPATHEFIPSYLGLVERIKAAGRPRLFSGR